MAVHSEKLAQLRETVSLAQNAWPSNDAQRHLLMISKLAGQLIELCSAANKRNELSFKSDESESLSNTPPFKPSEPNASLEAEPGASLEAGRIMSIVRSKSEKILKSPAYSKPRHEGRQQSASKIFPQRRKSPMLSRSLSLRSDRSDNESGYAGKTHLNLFEDTLTPRERMVKVRELFRSIDLNGDKLVDWYEFYEAITSMEGVSVDEALKLFKELDKNSSGKISLNELDTHIRHLTFMEAKVRFLGIVGKDKVIDRKDWKLFCQKLNMSKSKMEKIWTKMDADRSGRVTYREFDDYVNLELTSGVLDNWFTS